MTRRPSSFPRRAFTVAAVLLSGVTTIARAQAKALSLAEVIDLREHGVSSRQILRSAREYCIGFAVDDSTRRRLTVVGADTILIGGLTSVCTTVRAPEKPLAPILDDEFAQSSTAQGFVWANPRCKARFEADGVRMESTGADAMCMVRYPSDEVPTSVRIDLDVVQLASAKAGSIVLGFGRQELSGNYYAMTVTGDGHVELCWNADRQCSVLAKLGSAVPLHAEPADTNRVSVELRGPDITMLINGKRVGQYTADGTVKGRLMIGVGPQTSLLLVKLRATPLR